MSPPQPEDTAWSSWLPWLQRRQHFGLAMGQAIVNAAPAVTGALAAELARSQGEWDAAFLKEEEDLAAEDEHE